MKAMKSPAVVILLLLIALTAAAQQKRQTTPKPQPKAAAPQVPAPTFDTLVPADSYILYGEVRGVGQFIRSSALNDLLEPVLKLSGPPKEFRAMVNWLNAHAEEVMTSRLLVATWPTKTSQGVPDVLIAIEFASAEEATKFSASLNEFLPKVLPPAAPEPSLESSPRPEALEKLIRPEGLEKPKGPPPPNFHLKRFGSLVVLSPKPWTIKQLKPVGSKLLAEDVNFRTAHNRFSSEPLFVYVDTKTIKHEEEEQKKVWEQQRIDAEKQAAAQRETKKEDEESPEPDEMTEEEKAAEAEEMATLEAAPSPEPKEGPDAAAFSIGLWSLFSTFDSGESAWPDGLAFGLSFEDDSFDLRALLVSQPGEKSDALPFMSMLIAGPPVTPEAANIFPADTELMVTMSLDLPQIYATMSKPRPREQELMLPSVGTNMTVKETEPESPFAEIEKQLKINIKNDLLPLLGPEVAVRLPLNNMNVIGLPGITPAPAEIKEEPAKSGPVVAIAIKDREAMRALMPKLIEALGFKGASALAQTEQREDTEIVSYANAFAYAFVGNFLVISGDAASTRYVVDSYLKHETLSTDVQFRNSTRWQPKPQQGQLYISPLLMESYKVWAEKPSTRVSDQTRTFLMRASSMPQPITYSLSNEGLGPLHEVHIPKNLVLMAVAGISGESNPPQNLQNERSATSLMYTIANAEIDHKKRKGGCVTLEQLIAEGVVSKDMVENSGYKFDVSLTGDKFELSAVPAEYGKTGVLSFFIDNTFVLRGGDRNGAAASVSDPPIN